MGVLCQQFIYLFVTWKKVISLEEAALQIYWCKSSEQDDLKDKKLKTTIRRLYDIANVLQSIGLIQKSHAKNSNKPAFQWIGPKNAR